MKILITFYLSFIFSGIVLGDGFNSITTPDGVNIIAVGNSGNVFRSGNSGVNWTSITNGSLNLNCVTSLNNDVWVAAQNGNIYKTLKTYSPFSNYNVGTSNNLNSIFFVNANTGFVCGDAGSVYKSTNGGINWFSSSSGISSVKLSSINFKDLNTGIVVGNNGSIFKTTNGGSSWTSQTSGTTRNLLKVKFFNDSLAAVGEYGTLILNTGSGWSSVPTRINSDIGGVSGTNMKDVHMCGGGGFIRNNRNGSSKFLNFEINPMMANLVDIYYYNINLGFAVSSLNNAIIRTTDSGLVWDFPQGTSTSMNWIQKTPTGSGIGNNLCLHPTDRNSYFVVYGSTVFVSRDKGETWNTIATIAIGSRAHSFYVNPLDTNIWMAAMESSPDKIVRTTNYGATWTVIVSNDFSTYGQPLEMDQNDPHIFYFAPLSGFGAGVLKSTDIGETFSLVSGYNDLDINQPSDLIVMWDSSNVLFMGDNSGSDIYKSTNSALTWIEVKPNTSSFLPSMCNTVFDKSICYATTWSSSQVFRTLDYGENWNIVSNNSGSGWASDISREDPTVVLTGNYGAQSYLSTNGGSSFFNVNSGLGGAGAGMMVPDRSTFLNMQTGRLYKLNVTYSVITYPPDTTSAYIDVQSISVGSTGIQVYSSSTITPTATVKNNNPYSSATFSVTRKINPGGYSNTQSVNNLSLNSSTIVSFTPWTFLSGQTYTIKDSVFILGDNNHSNDTLSGSITPFFGLTTTKLNETFTSVTFPPTNWSLTYTGQYYWFRSNVSSYGSGTGSAKFDIWNSSMGVNQSLNSLTFNPSATGDSLKFDLAYAPFPGATDSLIIETSTNGGSNYASIVRLYGNNNGGATLNTTAQSTSEFTPNSNQWGTRAYALPVGTNKLKFRAVSGYGNNIYLDSIRIFGLFPFTMLTLKVAPEGLYNRFTLNMKDTVSTFLRSNKSPYSKVDSCKGVLDTVTFVVNLIYNNVTTGNYYIQVNHRNSIETWSKANGEAFTAGATLSYDFTTSQNKAYGNNLVLKSGLWCIYSGDVDQNGIIDAADIIAVYNDAAILRTGYVSTDLNGDNFVDVSDIVITFNNVTNVIGVIRP